MGHDPAKAGSPPPSVPAGSMRMPPTAARRTDVCTVDERLAWLEQQVRSLAAATFRPAHTVTVGGEAGESADRDLRVALQVLADFWNTRIDLLLSQAHAEESGTVRYEKQGRAWELRQVCEALAHLLAGLPLASSPAVQQLVDDAVAGQAAKVASCVVDLIEAWTERARASDEAATAYAAARDTNPYGPPAHGQHIAQAEAEADASAVRRCIAELRHGSVVPA
jgi:hypothetical protein